MTKPARSPVLGYNHNIQFHGHVFHVQTEDSGAQHARVFTHLFFEGTILASKKHEYDPDAAEDAVRLTMQQLHKAMIKELKEGLHDPRILAFFQARGETITLGDRPSLVQMPAVADAPGAGAVPMAAVAPPSAIVSAPVAPVAVVNDRPMAVSGSIETSSQPKRADAPAVGGTPAPQGVPARRPAVVVKPMIKAPELKRPPVVVSSSAEGVVVKRNVVINVGGGGAPVQGQISRGAAVPRPAIPYVVREGSYPLPTVSRGSGPHQAAPTTQPPPADGAQASARDVRMPWDGDAAGAARRPTGVSEHTPQGRAAVTGTTEAVMRTRTPSERAPADRAFANDLPNDKSLDEVILEYLSDDAE
ncbi:MAG TPA: hypothetical protein VHJ20_04215 [Polyangia bacterium]|nr:hypothetical protein [Polyangia bacterium]